MGEHLGWPLTDPIRVRSSQGVEVRSARCPESGAGTGLGSRLECRGQQARTLASALTPPASGCAQALGSGSWGWCCWDSHFSLPPHPWESARVPS